MPYSCELRDSVAGARVCMGVLVPAPRVMGLCGAPVVPAKGVSEGEYVGV